MSNYIICTTAFFFMLGGNQLADATPKHYDKVRISENYLRPSTGDLLLSPEPFNPESKPQEDSPRDVRSGEVVTCDDKAATSILTNSTFEKLKSQAIELFSASPGPNTPRILALIRNWTSTISNIRQHHYDAINNIRYCVADFEYQHMPPAEIAVALTTSLSDPTCARAISYKVEALLDKPGQFYVSWQCLR